MVATYSAKSVTVREDVDAVFEVERSGTAEVMDQSSSVSFRTEDVTAKAGTDYTATSGTLEFAAGETSKSVAVAILPEAFDKDGVETFLFRLEGYGAAVGSIKHGDSQSNTQVYWLVPGDGTKQPVPTSSSAGAWAKAQMDVDKFSDPPPDDTYEALPHSYLRIGHARADMNFPERVIAESADFFATAFDDGEVVLTDDGTPIEPGATLNHARPRNIDRLKSDWEEKKTDNKHLDGIFLYTKGNMTTSAHGTASYVVHGEYVQHIGGEAWYNFMGPVTRIYLSPEDGILRNAEGSQKVMGEYLDFSVTRTRTLDVLMNDSVKYVTSKEFAVNTSFQTDVFTGAKLDVSNSARLEVAGVDLRGKYDVRGNYELDYMASDHSSTKKNHYQSATEQFVVQIDPLGGGARKKSLTGVAALNMASAAAAATTAAVPFDLSKEAFAGIANPDELNKTFGQLWDVGYPSTFYGLMGISVGLLIAVVYQQKIKAITPSLTSKIKMTPTELELSVGASKMVMSNTGIEFTAPEIALVAEEAVDLAAETMVVTTDDAIDFAADIFQVTGATRHIGEVTLLGSNLVVDGVVQANNVDAGI